MVLNFFCYNIAEKADGKKKNKNIVRPGTKPKQDIKSMFAAAAVSTKRKPEVIFFFCADVKINFILL